MKTDPAVFFVGDAAPFNESDHPRDNEGKSSTSAGGGASTPHIDNPKGTNLNWQVAKVFKDTGMKKVKGEALPTFIAANGVKIVVHPTPGQKSSSKWSAHEPGGVVHEYTGHQKLQSLIQQLTGQKVPEAAPEKETEGVTAANIEEYSSIAKHAQAYKDFEAQGYKKDPKTDNGGYDYFRNEDGSSFKINEKGTWGFFTEFGDVVTGEGIPGLKAQIANFSGQELEEDPGVIPAIDPKEVQFTIAKNNLQGKGYYHTDSDGTAAIFENSNGAKVSFNIETEDWVAVSPGHMTKEGKGAGNLSALLSGKPAVIAPGSPPPWKNSNKTITTKADKSKSEALQKEQIEKNKWSEKQKAVYQKLKELAPPPTGPQKSAISTYTGSSYKTINSTLRHNPKNLGNYKEVIDNLDAYLKTSTIPEQVVLRRGVSDTFATFLKSIAYPGASFMEKGFMSTSAKVDWTWGDLKMEVVVPAGTKGAAVGNMSQHSQEAEVLFPRGTICKITAYDPDTHHIQITLDTSHI